LLGKRKPGSDPQLGGVCRGVGADRAVPYPELSVAGKAAVGSTMMVLVDVERIAERGIDRRAFRDSQ
jgi:hypothetical protein